MILRNCLVRRWSDGGELSGMGVGKLEGGGEGPGEFVDVLEWFVLVLEPVRKCRAGVVLQRWCGGNVIMEHWT